MLYHTPPSSFVLHVTRALIKPLPGYLSYFRQIQNREEYWDFLLIVIQASNDAPVSQSHSRSSVSSQTLTRSQSPSLPALLFQSVLSVIMIRITCVIFGLLVIIENSRGKPSIGASVGITNLFTPSPAAPYVHRSYPSYLDYLYQHPSSLDNSLETNEYFENLVVDDKNYVEASYDGFTTDLYGQDRQVSSIPRLLWS